MLLNPVLPCVIVTATKDVLKWLLKNSAFMMSADGLSVLRLMYAAYKVDVVYKMDPVTHVTATVPTITPMVHNAYAWIDKAYFLPIARTEMNKNSKADSESGL